MCSILTRILPYIFPNSLDSVVNRWLLSYLYGDSLFIFIQNVVKIVIIGDMHIYVHVERLLTFLYAQVLKLFHEI